MKRLYIYIICCVALAAPVAGQTVSLKECVAVGIANNLTLDNARIGMQKGRTTLSQSRSRLLPTGNRHVPVDRLSEESRQRYDRHFAWK